MRITLKKIPVRNAGGANAGGVADDPVGTSTEFEVPNTTIAKISAVIGIAVTIIQALTAVVSSFVIDLPKGKVDVEANRARLASDIAASRAKLELVEQNFKIQMLQRVLVAKEPADRENSLKLLIAAGLLADPENKIANLIQKTNSIPAWKDLPPEALKESLSLVNPAPGGVGNVSQQRIVPGSAVGNSNSAVPPPASTPEKPKDPTDPPGGGR